MTPELTLFIVISRSDDMVRAWVRELAEEPTFTEYPKIVVYDKEKAHLIPEISALLDPIRTVQTPVADPSQLSEIHLKLIQQVQTPYFVVLHVPRHATRALESVRGRLTQGIEATQQLSRDSAQPIFIYTPQRRRVWLRVYLWQMLRSYPSPAAPLRDYLGYLAMQAGTHALEGIDPSDNKVLEFQARSALGRFNLVNAPPWRFRIAIVGRDGEILTEARAIPQLRVDSRGEYRWENLRARLDVGTVPDGNHRIRLFLETDDPALRIARELAPSAGLLASARTRAIHYGQQSTFFLVHTTGAATVTWVTIRQGPLVELARSWERDLRRKDIRALFRDHSTVRLQFSRLVRLLTKPFVRGKEFWLIGEREDTAQDNGMHLFRFLRIHHPHRKVYYVINRTSPHWERVAPLGNVVAHSSLKHRFLMLHTAVIANAYSFRHMTPRQWNPLAYTRYLAWRVGAQRVYLKHGVHMAPNMVKRGVGGYDLYLTSGPKETAAFRSYSGYDTQLVETGLPRYDALVPTPPSRTVLFMPTWRRYLIPKLSSDTAEADVPFHGSTYEQFLRTFLTSPRLHHILDSHDYTLQFLPHYNLREHLAELPITHPRVHFADTEKTPLQDFLTSCDVFITDYSSVQFDVAYVGTPVIYAQFDLEEYRDSHASVSWFDYSQDGFGPVTTTVDETLEALEKLLDEQGSREETYQARMESIFTHRDLNNSARVVTAIDGIIDSYKRELSPRSTSTKFSGKFRAS